MTGQRRSPRGGPDETFVVHRRRSALQGQPPPPAVSAAASILLLNDTRTNSCAVGKGGMTPLDYLVLAPHPDDAEIGMGGTIALLLHQGYRVGVLDLTDGEPTPHGSPEIRARETEAATQVLGLSWRGNLGLINRNLQADLESRAKLAGMLRQLKPQVLFAPYWEDAHPDHVAASALVDASRFWAKLTKCDLPGDPHFPRKIYYYFSIHLRIHPRPSFVVDISPFLETKMQAVSCFRSQLLTGRSTTPPTLLEDIQDRSRYWGWTIGTHYGEPFASREEIGLRSLEHLA